MKWNKMKKVKITEPRWYELDKRGDCLVARFFDETKWSDSTGGVRSLGGSIDEQKSKYELIKKLALVFYFFSMKAEA